MRVQFLIDPSLINRKYLCIKSKLSTISIDIKVTNYYNYVKDIITKLITNDNEMLQSVHGCWLLFFV